jgi:hypothetical protein
LFSEFQSSLGGALLVFGSGDMAQLGLGMEEDMRERKFPTVVKTLLEEEVRGVCYYIIFKIFIEHIYSPSKQCYNFVRALTLIK